MTTYQVECPHYQLSVDVEVVCGETQPEPPAAEPRELVWSDEFNADGPINPSKWTAKEYGSDPPRLSAVTKDSSNVRVENGNLIIEAHHHPGETPEYTAGWIESKFKGDWLYGRFEARMKLPSGAGTWPAFWLYPSDAEYGAWPNNYSGEVDILEYWGEISGQAHGTIHNYRSQEGITLPTDFIVSVPTAETEFHVYALEWSPDKLDFFLDDVKFGSYENNGKWTYWPFDKRFHVILSLFVPSYGQRDPNAFPARLEVDYVRVYQNG